MLESISNCPICESTEQIHQLDAKDYLVSGEVFSIQKCSNCEFQFTSPRPTNSNIIKYYKSDSYVSHSNKSNSPINLIYRFIRKYTIYQKLQMINRFATQGSLLDYGCGTGHLVNYALSKGWKVTGIEPDPDARKIAAASINEKNVFESIDELKDKVFNVVTLFHVLEHIHNLNTTVNKLVESLSDQGILIVAVPNHNSYDAQKYKSGWAAYDLPRHLYHFDSKSISGLAEKNGLKVVAQLPMYFDSYYVSLLSEKNLGNKLYPLAGMYNGFVSNMKAKSTKEYSSLIYVLQKK
jgi:SAM-dependent methyltransferase